MRRLLTGASSGLGRCRPRLEDRLAARAAGESEAEGRHGRRLLRRRHRSGAGHQTRARPRTAAVPRDRPGRTAGAPRPLPARLDGLALAAGSPVSPAAVITTVHSELLRHTRGRIADDVAPLVLRNDPSRVPAQCGDATLRRARREPSNRCSHRQPRDCRAAGAARPAAECRADQQGRRREKGPPHCTRGSRRPGRLCERHLSQPAHTARRQSARGTDRGTPFTPRANRPPLR